MPPATEAFAAGMHQLLAELAPRIAACILLCDGVVVAGRRFCALVREARERAREMARDTVDPRIGEAGFVALCICSLVPGGAGATCARVLFDSGEAHMAEAYRILCATHPELEEQACLFALTGGTCAAAAFLRAGGDEARERLAARRGHTAMDVLLDALERAPFLHCGDVACEHASSLLAAWRRALPAAAAADAHRSAHRLARSAGLLRDARWSALCSEAALWHEEQQQSPRATPADWRRAAGFWRDVHESASCVLSLAHGAAGKRQRRAALFVWFFSDGTLYMMGRLLVHSKDDANGRGWVAAAALEAELTIRSALGAAAAEPQGPKAAELQRLHADTNKFDVQALPGDAMTPCVAAAVKEASGRKGSFSIGAAQPRRRAASAVVVFSTAPGTHSGNNTVAASEW